VQAARYLDTIFSSFVQLVGIMENKDGFGSDGNRGKVRGIPLYNGCPASLQNLQMMMDKEVQPEG